MSKTTGYTVEMARRHGVRCHTKTVLGECKAKRKNFACEFLPKSAQPRSPHSRTPVHRILKYFPPRKSTKPRRRYHRTTLLAIREKLHNLPEKKRRAASAKEPKQTSAFHQAARQTSSTFTDDQGQLTFSSRIRIE